jgi:Gpi18-like mannosyltransferase
MMTTDEVAQATPEASTNTGWRPAITTAITVWGAAVIGYVLINGMVWMTRNESGPPFSGMIEVWDQWDTGHYVTIALTGYNAATENPAFFPLYSMVMRILEPVLPGGMLSAGLIISNVSCVVALVLFYRLVQDLAGQAMASRSVFYLMAYPFAFFLSAAYNEAFFLMFTVAALYFMRRSMWLLAGVMGAFASATRQAGVLLALAFAVEYLRQRDWNWRAVRADVLAIALVPVGVASYALYCWQAFGDPLKFVHVQAAWGRAATWPWLGTWRAMGTVVEAARGGAVFQPIIVLNVIDILSVLVTLTLLVLSVVGPWRLNRESLYLVVFSATSYLVILISPIGLSVPLHGLPRYVLETLPAFMVLARMGANRNLERLYVMPALLTQGVLLLTFYFDIWIA